MEKNRNYTDIATEYYQESPSWQIKLEEYLGFIRDYFYNRYYNGTDKDPIEINQVFDKHMAREFYLAAEALGRVNTMLKKKMSKV
jgi:hypothetical protein